MLSGRQYEGRIRTEKMADFSDTDTHLAGIERSIQLLIKLKLAEVQGEKSQTEMILMLGGCGCTAGEIAALLGRPKTSVAPILSRAKGKKRGN